MTYYVFMSQKQVFIFAVQKLFRKNIIFSQHIINEIIFEFHRKFSDKKDVFKNERRIAFPDC